MSLDTARFRAEISTGAALSAFKTPVEALDETVGRFYDSLKNVVHLGPNVPSSTASDYV